MNKLTIFAALGFFLTNGISAQETSQEISLFSLFNNLPAEESAQSLYYKSNDTVNSHDNNKTSSFIQNLADTNAIPGVEVYEPSLHWALILFITFMSIMLVIVGGMIALKSIWDSKNPHKVIRDMRGNTISAHDDDDE